MNYNVHFNLFPNFIYVYVCVCVCMFIAIYCIASIMVSVYFLYISRIYADLFG